MNSEIQSLIQKLFNPMPDFPNGTVGDNAYVKLCRLISIARLRAHSQRLESIWLLRCDPDRKARLKSFKRQPEPLWQMTPMGMDQRIHNRFLTES